MRRCAFCNVEIEEGRRSDLYHEVIGWEKGRKQGGTNALRIRQRTGAVAHSFCVDRAAQGLHPHQETLWSG